MALVTIAALGMDALNILRLLPAGALRRQEKKTKKRQLSYSRAFSSAAKRIRAQALWLNRSGKARTRDHQMPILPTGIGSSQKPSKIAGKDKWNCAMPEYICLVGEILPELPQRAMPSMLGGPAAHKRGCSLVLSDLVMCKHRELAAERHAQSL